MPQSDGVSVGWFSRSDERPCKSGCVSPLRYRVVEFQKTNSPMSSHRLPSAIRWAAHRECALSICIFGITPHLRVSIPGGPSLLTIQLSLWQYLGIWRFLDTDAGRCANGSQVSGFSHGSVRVFSLRTSCGRAPWCSSLRQHQEDHLEGDHYQL